MIGVGVGSTSPLNQQLIPQSADIAGEVEPVFQTAQMTDMLPIVLVAQTENLSPQAQSVTPQIMPPNGWAQILSKYTSMDGQGLVRFDYGGLRSTPSDMKLLADYIAKLSTKSPSAMANNEAMAYWANLYNALTVQVVAQNYPVTSIRKIKSGRRKGPWKRKLVRVEGQDLSLDNIEHDILRPTYKTPLVHYMVNCASIGCPNLKTSPWQAATLQADMEAAALAYIGSERGAKFENNRLEVSRIYKWFKKDFGNSETGVLEHLRQYGDADIRQKLATRTKIDKYGYDWALNAP
ncbi:MAG: DUF547 domain-containing protein [Robiginitomaculum sp.]|nr:DUF547 domain-containing protein [Robiginitomaculum sp.]